MKKVLYISTVSLVCGGAERVISILSSQFAKNFDQVKIFIWLDKPIFYPIDNSIEIINIPQRCQSNNLFLKMLWFRNFVKKNPPHAILSFLAKSSIPVIYSTIFLPPKIIIAERNDPRNLKGGYIMRKIRDFTYNFADAILEQTNNNKNYFKGKKFAKTSVIYNPVFMDNSLVGSALNTPKSNIIVNVGRLEPQKDQKTLIKAFAIFHKKHPEYKLYIYGEGNERAELERLINELNLSQQVLLPGSIGNIFECIKKAKAFVLTSKFEGMPNALIEAMCLGLPCISTKVSGATDLIQNNINGKLVNIGNVDEIVSALTSITEDDTESYTLGNNATQLYEKLNVSIISKEWINYINKFV